MDQAPPPPAPGVPFVEARPQGVRVIGILSIVFASCLLLCGLCYSAQVAMQPLARPMMQAQTQQIQAQVDKSKQDELDTLNDALQAASSDEEKADIEARIRAVEMRPKPFVPDMSALWGPNSTPLVIFGLSDALSGLVLNLLLLIVGIGLVQLAEWGRRLALWTAGIKLVRLVVVYGYYLVAVVPEMTRVFVDMMQKAMPPGQAGGGPNPTHLAAGYGIMLGAYGVGAMLVGSIFPAISLWVLSRPGARAACVRGRSEAPRP